MSGAGAVRTSLLSSSDIEARAANYLQRRQFWDWTQDDQADLDRWLAASSIHLVTYLRLEAAWSRSERLVALRSSERNEIETSVQKRSWSIPTRVAMGLVLGIALSVTGWRYFQATPDTVYTTSIGAHRLVMLSDNTSVELNTDTILRVNGRTARLERGEAYFQIKHDPAHPFVVWAASHRITDLGTEFVVRNDAARLEVTLVEGRARLDSISPDKPGLTANLEPGDVAVATTEAIAVARKPMRDVTESLGWRRGLLTFRHATLADAAAEFNRYNTGKLIIADPDLGQKKIVGTFQAGNEKLFAEVLRELLGLRISKSGDDTVISR